MDAWREHNDADVMTTFKMHVRKEREQRIRSIRRSRRNLVRRDYPSLQNNTMNGQNQQVSNRSNNEEIERIVHTLEKAESIVRHIATNTNKSDNQSGTGLQQPKMLLKPRKRADKEDNE